MGRFYKTSRSQMLDFTLKLPEELMIKSVQFNDQMINKSLEGLEKLSEVNVGHGFGEIDTNRMKEINDIYDKKINSATENLYNNTLNWRNIIPDIKNIGKEMYINKTRGEWGLIEGNYNAYQTSSQNLDKLVQEHPDKYTPEDIQKLKTYEYIKWQGTNYNPEKGTYNTFSPVSPAEYVDLGKLADLEGKGFKADENTTYNVTSDGRYWKKTISGLEEVSPQEVYNAVTSRIYGDPKAMAYLQQRFMVDSTLDKNFSKQFEKLVDVNGNPIKDINGNIIGQKDNPAQNYIDYMVYKNATAPMIKYSYQKIKSGTTGITADPFELQKQRAKDAKELAKYKYNLAHPKTAITDTYNASTTVNQILDPNKFNVQGIREQINILKNGITDTQNNVNSVDRLLKGNPNEQDKQIFKKATGNDYTGTITPEERQELESYKQNQKIFYNNYQDNLKRLKNIGNQANNDVTDELVKNGKYTQNQVDWYKANYTRGNEIEKHNKEYYQAIRLISTTGKASYGIGKQTLINFGYSEQEAQQIINDHNHYKLYKSLKTDYGTELNNWYSTNQKYNQIEFTGVDLTQFNNDPTIKAGLYNAVVNSPGVYSNDMLAYADPSSYTTTYKKHIIGRKRGLFFSNLTQEQFNDYVTPLAMTNIGDEFVAVDYHVDEKMPGIKKLKSQEGKNGVIRIIYKRDSPVIQQLAGTIIKNKTPNSDFAQGAMETIVNPAYSEVVTMGKEIARNSVISNYTPDNTATPQIFYWYDDKIKTSIQPITINGNTTYQVFYYIKDDKTNKYKPYSTTDSNTPTLFNYPQIGNVKPVFSISQDIQTFYYNLNSQNN